MYKKIRIFLIFILFSLVCEAKEIVFLSTQLNPIEEATAMRNIILKNFSGKVLYKPYNDKEIYSYLAKEKVKPNLIGGLYGDFMSLKKDNLIINMEDIYKTLGNQNFISKFNEMSKLDTNNHYFIPWMQATYVMVANKKSLKYLPKKADINNLTYDQFIEWGANIYRETGTQKIGFPAGESGLFHRFLQGYLYPSYTNNMVKKFRTSEAVQMWTKLKELWYYVTPESLTYSKMDVPLLSEKVWIAWDHSARLINVFKQNSNDFISFPAPIGPKGRGYLLVLAGIGVPVGSPPDKSTIDLIKYLTKDETQLLTMNTVGFFPVVEIKSKINPQFENLYSAVMNQSKSNKSIASLVPTNLGIKSGDFNNTYLRTFSQIVLRDKNIEVVLKEQGKKLQEIFNESGAYIWIPDKMKSGSVIIE